MAVVAAVEASAPARFRLRAPRTPPAPQGTGAGALIDFCVSAKAS
jgi:hypothetical protein